jgi:hypothetical protein
MKRNEVLIADANCNVDPAKADEVICNLLTDPDVSVHDAFNDIVYRYLKGSEDFKQGIDCALTILTQYNLTEIAQKVFDASKEVA